MEQSLFLPPLVSLPNVSIAAFYRVAHHSFLAAVHAISQWIQLESAAGACQARRIDTHTPAVQGKRAARLT